MHLASLCVANANVSISHALARFVACKNENFNGSEMLRSHWPIATCLPRNLQLFLVILKGFLELAERLKGVSNIRIRPALTRFVAYENGKCQRICNAAI